MLYRSVSQPLMVNGPLSETLNTHVALLHQKVHTFLKENI